jgi:hypothetical protein
MALVTINRCLDCGQKYNAVNDPHGFTCHACIKTHRIRKQFGQGEQADRLFALLHPAEYEREQQNHRRHHGVP